MKSWFRSLVIALPVVALAAVASVAGAADKGKGKPPAEDVPAVDESTIAGRAFIRSNVEYQFPKFTVDGKEWDNHEVQEKRTLLIFGLERENEHTVVITPQAGYEAQTITIKPSDWKRMIVRQKGSTKTLEFHANFKLDFAKAK